MTSVSKDLENLNHQIQDFKLVFENNKKVMATKEAITSCLHDNKRNEKKADPLIDIEYKFKAISIKTKEERNRDLASNTKALEVLKTESSLKSSIRAIQNLARPDLRARRDFQLGEFQAIQEKPA